MPNDDTVLSADVDPEVPLLLATVYLKVSRTRLSEGAQGASTANLEGVNRVLIEAKQYLNAAVRVVGLKGSFVKHFGRWFAGDLSTDERAFNLQPLTKRISMLYRDLNKQKIQLTAVRKTVSQAQEIGGIGLGAPSQTGTPTAHQQGVAQRKKANLPIRTLATRIPALGWVPRKTRKRALRSS